MLVNSFNILKNPFHRRLYETRGHEAILKDGSPTLADPHRDVFGLKAQLYLGSEFEMCVALATEASTPGNNTPATNSKPLTTKPKTPNNRVLNAVARAPHPRLIWRLSCISCI